MPSLGGFLKKKRTREGNTDPSPSNPTSPVSAVTPAASKLFDSTLPRSLPAQAPAASTAQPGSAVSASAPASIPVLEKQQQHMMNPANAQGSSYATPASTVHDSQNLPSISNLINSSQNDGSANNSSSSTAPYPANSSLGHQMSHTTSASPGTDPARLQQQQQQAHPVPAMPSPQQTTDHQQPPPQQQSQPQHHYQQHHHQISISEPRVTKGKYSLGDFEILRTLGTGSFGRVHLVQSKHNQRFYAVKVLKKAQVVKMKQVEHTNDERRMLSDVKHPFLITLWGTFQDWKNLYMVMDFVEGGELFSLLRKSGVSPLSFRLTHVLP